MSDTAANRLHFEAVLMIVAVLAWTHFGCSTEESKPIKEIAIITHFRTPPPTLNEMTLSADAVVVGRLTGSRPADQEDPPRIKTLWTLKVREVLHMGGSTAQPDEMLIEREGGDRDRGSHVERVIQPEFPAFEPGEEYLLFLRKAGESYWWPAYGPDSAFRLSHGRVEAVGTSKVALSQNGQAEVELLRTIRNFGK